MRKFCLPFYTICVSLFYYKKENNLFTKIVMYVQRIIIILLDYLTNDNLAIEIENRTLLPRYSSLA